MKLIIILCIILLSCAHAQTVTWVASTKVYGGNSCSDQSDCEAKCGADTTCEGWSTISSSVIAARNTNWCDQAGCKTIYGYLNGYGNFMASYPGGCSCSSSSCTYNSYCGHSWHNTCNTGGKQCYGPTTVYSYTYGTATADTGGTSQLVADRDGICGTNYHVVSNACVACGIGLLNAMGDDSSGPDTTCNAVPCAVNEHVVNGICTACATGYIRDAGDDPTAGNTECASTFCAVNEKVVSNACVPCPAGKDNADGTSDSYLLADTTCDVVYCGTNQKVVSNVCTACEPGMENVAGDDATGADTTCEPTYCNADHKVVNHVCTPCGLGTNVAGDDASQGNTVCEEPTYEASTKVYSGSTCSNDIDCQNKCAADSNCDGYTSVTTSVIGPRSSNWCDQAGCQAIKGYLNGNGNFMMNYPGGCSCSSSSCTYNSYCGYSWHTTCNKGGKQCYGPSTSTSWSYGPETAADGGTSFKLISNGQECGENFRVQNHACVACVAPHTNAKGDHIGGADTACDCAAGYVLNTNTNLCEPIVCNENERVNDQSQCVACGADTLREAGDKASDGETQCYPTPDSSIALRSLNAGHEIVDAICLGIKIVDYDDDGNLDIIYFQKKQSGCNIGSNYIEYYRNTGTNVNPNYVKTKVLARSNSAGPATPYATIGRGVKDIHVHDFDNDGIKDILTEGGTYLNTGYEQMTMKNHLYKGHATEFLQISNGNDHIWMAQGPFSLTDLNGDGYIDLMASGGQEAIKYYFNKADGTIGFNIHSSYRGKCSMGKYQLIAGKPEVAIIQGSRLEDGWQNFCPSLSSTPRWRLELTTRVGLGSWVYVENLSPQPTAYVNEAEWVDFDNDGDDELVVLTNNELILYSFTSTQSIDYPNTISNVNLNSTVISSHANENDAKTTCDADSECKAIQLTISGQWEAIKGDLAYIEAAAGKVKLKVINSAVTGSSGVTLDAYVPCSICGRVMNEIIVADVKKIGNPQLILIDSARSGSTAYLVTVSKSSGSWTSEINDLKTLVPVVATAALGQISDDTFRSLTSSGFTVNSVLARGATSMSSTIVSYPISCAVNERTVNGVCEACPTGSTSNGVSDPMASPNTGCVRADNTCLENEHVKNNECFKCISPETNAAGDDASGANTACDCVNTYAPCDGGIEKYTGTCDGVADKSCGGAGGGTCVGSFGSCDVNSKKIWSNTEVPADGNMSSCTHPSGYVASCECNGAQYADNGVCRACPAGATANLVNYDPISGDTVCLCQGKMGSDGTTCYPCPTGRTNALVNYDPTSGVKECVVTSCRKDFYVSNHVCTACPHNSQRLSGDDPVGPDTRCHCKINSKVIGGDCLACETGSTNPKLCYASKEGGDTYCTCDDNYYAAASKVCTKCPANSKNEAGDYAGDGPTYCNCKQGYHVESGVCKKCQDNSLSVGSDEIDGGDTYCTCSKDFYASSGVCTACPANTFNDAPTKSNVDGTCKCDANFKVKNNACVACELTSTRVGGSVMSGPDTYCKCGRNEKVINNECVVCETGSSFPGERHSSGDDNQCICNAGYQKNSITKLCEECPAGTHSFSPHGADAPCLCKVGYYVKTPGTCEECPTGSTSEGGNTYTSVSTCILQAGYFVDSSGDVQACPAGSNSLGGELVSAGETKCVTEANHYVDTNGDIQDCPANSAVSGGILLEARATISGCICNKGFQAVGSACGQCPNGQTTDGTHRTDQAQRGCHCKAGFYVDDSDHTCKECSVGGSTAEGGDPNGASTSCDCAANYRVNGNAQCELCQPGETNAPLDQTQAGETQCDITYCNENQRVENNACVSCPTGMINEKDDPANSVNTICDYKGDAEDQYEFDISGTKFLVQKKDGTNLGLNPKLTLRISEGPFTFSRQPASTAGDDLVIAEAVTWATPNVAYDTYVQLASLEAVDDVKVAVWEPNLPGTFYYLSKDTNTMVGEIEVTLPLCVIGTSGNTQLQNSCILPNEITLIGDLDISVTSSRRRFLRKNLKSGEILVQAAANSRHFSVPAGTTLTINGFTLSDGNPGDAGGSILASGGSVVAEGITFKNNKGTTGGAIEAEKDQANNEPSVSIKSSTFDNNEGTGGGGAINAKAGAFIVEGTTFKNNKAPNGDGGALASVTDITIKTSVFESNSAPTGSGGAVSIDGKKLTMSDTTLKSNEAQNGGAVGVKEGEADLQTITVESNTATSEGGAILVDKSDVTIASSNIKENNGANGGGIKTKNMNGKRLEANSNTFNGNKGTSGGGAFHFEDEAGADITIFESSFLNNKGAADENDDMKAAGTSQLKVKMVDMLTEIVRKAMPPPDCSTVSCGHRTKSIAKARTDGSCKCACDGINEYEKDRKCTPITVCGPGEVSVVDPSDESDRICGSQTIKDKQAEFDAAGAALSSLVTNKLKESGLGDSDAFNLAVDMVGGVNKC